ncbi:MAG: GDP-mannose 4,6-dehydratase [Actinobacteria bacterium]|nr:GDP-mannose 4,6-dehydratase [Actinomycetota bacterium]
MGVRLGLFDRRFPDGGLELRVVVTGAGGFVGGFMVEELLAAGHEVAAFIHTNAGRNPWAGSAAGYGRPAWVRSVDVTSQHAMDDALAEVIPEGVVHLAARADPGSSWRHASETYCINILGTSVLLEVLRRYAPRVLLVGSALQYARPGDGSPLSEEDPLAAESPYSLSKITQEQIGQLHVARHGARAVWTRSFNHTGPGQSTKYAVGSFAAQAAAIQRAGGKGTFKVGNLGARRDFLDVRDVVKAYRLLLESGKAGQAYNVSSGSAVSLGSVLDSLVKLAGLEGSVEIQQAPRPANRDILVGNPTKIRDAVGWEPEIPLSKSLTDTLISYGGSV